MNLDNLLVRLETLRERVNEMYTHGSEALPQPYPSELMATAFTEVNTALRELHSELQGVREYWQMASNALHSMIYDWDVERDTVERTQGLVDVSGYRPEEAPLTKDWWIQRIHPDDREGAHNAVSDALASQTKFACEYRVLHKDGSYRYVWDRGLIIRKANGKVARVVGSTINVTERKQAEVSFRESERRFRAIFNNTFQLTGLLTPEGILLEVNQAALDFIGSEAGAVIGQPFWEVSCWSFSPTVQAQLQAAIASSAAGEFVRYEIEIPDADGCLHTFDFSLKPIKDETGQVILLVPEGRDITEIKQAQAALTQSEARLQTILDKSPVSIYLKDLQGRYLLINPECESLSGFSREQLIGKTDYQILPTAVADKLRANDQEVLDTLTPLVWEEVVPWKHELNTYISVKFPLFDTKGIPNAICGISTDITERKRAEEQIRFQARLLDVVEQAIVTTDLNGIITYWNRFAETLYGWHSTEVIGQNILEVTPAQVSKQLAAEILSRLQRGESWYGEFLVQRRDGTTFPAMVSDAPIFDGDGALIGIVGVTSDITQLKLAEVALRQANEELELRVQERTATLSETNRKLEAEIAERKQTEAALRQSEERFRSLSACSPVGMFETDIAGRCLYSNPRCQEIYGFTLEESLGDGWSQFVHPEDRDRVFAEWSLYTREGREYSNEFRVQTKERIVRWVHVRSSPMFSAQGELIGYVGTVEDITSRQQAQADILTALEKERELSELRNSFLSLVSHEFRTPLTTIRSSAELLERYNDRFSGEKKLTHYQRIQSAVERMTQLLDEVLLIGQAEAGKLKFEPTLIDLVCWCRDLVEEMQIVVENAHSDSSAQHTLSFTSSGDCIDAEMDEKLLGHILTNLLSNALKYSPGGGAVQFDLVCTDSEAVFRISDNGIGIPKSDFAHLFESFSRAQNVGVIQGTGLGLAIVKKAVDLHGGTIVVESEVGVGTTFNVTLPLRASV